MELPTVSSNSSISDNPELRNYYDNLLFKNQSGKSLTDLPRQLRQQHGEVSPWAVTGTRPAPRPDQVYPGDEAVQVGSFDFINGFQNTLTMPSTHGGRFNTPAAQFFQPTGERVSTASTGVSMPFAASNSFLPSVTQLHSRSNNDSQLFRGTMGRRMSTDNAPPTFGAATGPPAAVYMGGSLSHDTRNRMQQQKPIGSERRSSYISDHLIDAHPPHWNGPDSSQQQVPQIGGAYQPRQAQLHSRQNRPQCDTGDFNAVATYQSNNAVFEHGYRGQVDRHYTAAPELPMENGLLCINGMEIVSSPDLHQLYENCGLNYFSSQVTYEFIDYIKVLVGDAPKSSQHTEDSKVGAVQQFIDFLRNCNANFTSNAIMKDYNIGGLNKLGVNNSSVNVGNSSNFSQDKPLVLVALKNGKLELLSTQQNSNLFLKRGDLVIIDGDRGKDLVQVIEPRVSLNLALFTNFLKKKVHFDSLITSKSQHYPNSDFIRSLVGSKQGSKTTELNSKLYDVIELTQLIIPSKQVLRFATPLEVTTNLHHKFQDELKALHIAQLKLQLLNGNRQSNNEENGGSHAHKKPLNIKILNTEFQFDRKKLTFYYICEERNDFRELIKELFKFYKTRIWLCAIPNNLSIDSKYYDDQRRELNLYEDMVKNYTAENPKSADTVIQEDDSVLAPPLNKIQLDNFQIGVYKELVNELF